MQFEQQLKQCVTGMGKVLTTNVPEVRKGVAVTRLPLNISQKSAFLPLITHAPAA